MFIRSERLFLRPIWPEDWQAILPLMDDAVARNLATVPWPYGPEEARAFAGMSQHPRCPHFLITRPRGASGVDALGVIGLAEEAGEVAMGFWIARHHWGRGYATESGRALLGLARVLGHRRIVASHFLDNCRSARVLAKLGFCPVAGGEERFSAARGRPDAARRLVLDLDAPGNCDDEGPMPKAA